MMTFHRRTEAMPLSFFEELPRNAGDDDSTSMAPLLVARVGFEELPRNAGDDDWRYGA